MINFTKRGGIDSRIQSGMKTSQPTDMELLQRFIRNNDQDSFNQLVVRLQDFAYRLACRFSGNPAEADDVVQLSFIKVMELAGRFRFADTGSVRSWVGGIVLNTARNLARKRRRRKKYEDTYERKRESLNISNPEDRGEEKEVVLARVVDALPEKYRLPLTLKYMEGMTLDEVVQATGLNKGVVRGALERGVKTLRRGLTEAGVSCSGALLITLLEEWGETAAAEIAPVTLTKKLAGLPESASADVNKIEPDEVEAGGNQGIFVVALVGLLVGAGFLVTNFDSKQSNSGGQIATSSSDESEAEKELGLGTTYTFENGIPSDLKIFKGPWSILQGGNQSKPILAAPPEYLLSLRLPPLQGPHTITFTYKNMGKKSLAFMYPSDKSRLDMCLKRSEMNAKKIGSVKYGETYTSWVYLCGRYLIFSTQHSNSEVAWKAFRCDQEFGSDFNVMVGQVGIEDIHIQKTSVNEMPMKVQSLIQEFESEGVELAESHWKPWGLRKRLEDSGAGGWLNGATKFSAMMNCRLNFTEGVWRQFKVLEGIQINKDQGKLIGTWDQDKPIALQFPFRFPQNTVHLRLRVNLNVGTTKKFLRFGVSDFKGEIHPVPKMYRFRKSGKSVPNNGNFYAVIQDSLVLLYGFEGEGIRPKVYYLAKLSGSLRDHHLVLKSQGLQLLELELEEIGPNGNPSIPPEFLNLKKIAEAVEKENEQ